AELSQDLGGDRPAHPAAACRPLHVRRDAHVRQPAGHAGRRGVSGDLHDRPHDPPARGQGLRRLRSERPRPAARGPALRAPAARAVLREILDRLVADGGPVAVNTLRDPAAVAELDARDLVYVSDGRVMLAYPWSGTPTAFVAVLDDGHERWACCAIDALGLAP